MNLTSEQSTVVNLAAGRHLVLAPPGSGKTEMLSQRIIRALGSQVPPDKMLCATFTNRAAFEMRDRVSAAAGDMTLPDVGNLHHFCHRFLISVRKLQPGKHVLDEVQQREFVREVCDVLREELRSGQSADLKRTHGVTVMGGIRGICEPMRERIHGLLEGAFSDYARRDKDIYSDILSAVLISHQRRLGIPPCYLRPLPPEMFALTGADAIAAIERAYSGLKRKFLSVDFDDLIMKTMELLTAHPPVLEYYRGKFDYILVDEYQDTNLAQYELVRLLAGEKKNVCNDARVCFRKSDFCETGHAETVKQFDRIMKVAHDEPLFFPFLLLYSVMHLLRGAREKTIMNCSTTVGIMQGMRRKRSVKIPQKKETLLCLKGQRSVSGIRRE